MMKLKISRILVPVDFSKSSARSLQYALLLASKHHAKIFMLHVIHDPPEKPGFYSVKDDTGSDLVSLESSADAMMKKFLKKRDIARKKIKQIIMEPGIPHKRIIEIAIAKKIDLIVMASHAGGLKRFFLGSTAEKVLREARCPVLVTNKVATLKGAVEEVAEDISENISADQQGMPAEPV